MSSEVSDNLSNCVSKDGILLLSAPRLSRIIDGDDNDKSMPYTINIHSLNEMFIRDKVTQSIPDGTKKKLPAKRSRNPKNWKQNIRKEKRQHGQEYKDVNGQTRQKRCVKTMTCHSDPCPFMCSRKISQEEREIIHKRFWQLSDKEKLYFYSQHIKQMVAHRKRTEEQKSRKTYSYEYKFLISEVEIRVCQRFFLNTLDISQQRVYYYFKKRKNSPYGLPLIPKQGKHVKKKISEEQKDKVRNHIKSFPTIKSNCCHADNKKPVERNLTVRQMYDLYLLSVQEPVKFNMYVTIFKTEFQSHFSRRKLKHQMNCSNEPKSASR